MTFKTASTDHPIHSLLASRWSPYAWSDAPVAAEDLAALFEAARWAPSSYNEQPWRWILARREDKAGFEKLLSTLVETNQAWAKHAPVLALGISVGRFKRNGKANKAAQHDLGAAAAHLSFEATARGLAVHQMIGIEAERARELYRIPEEAEALTALAIGVAGEAADLPDGLRERDLAPRTRKPLTELVFANRFGERAVLIERN